MDSAGEGNQIVQEAAPSMFHCSYHVLLICKAEDTCETFAYHLHTALMQSGISTFRNGGELDKGENFESELQRGIKESRISIIIFSKDYASSKWCLDELVNILERKKTTGHMILPVFYDVNPSEVRKQAGSYAKALLVHEEKFMGETDERKKEGIAKIQRWKGSLREVADLAGLVLQDG